MSLDLEVVNVRSLQPPAPAALPSPPCDPGATLTCWPAAPMTRTSCEVTWCTVQATSDSSAVLLQLPHLSVEVLRKIVRKRIRTLPDLLQMSPQELDELLTSSGGSCGHCKSPVRGEA